MKRTTKITTLVLIGLLATLLVAVPIQPAKAQFVIAWTYDSEAGNFEYDEYGQGFFEYTLHTNYTDSNWGTNYPDYSSIYYFNESMTITGNAGYFLGLHVYAWMNSTLTGASDLVDGEDYIRVNVTVTNAYGVVVHNATDCPIFYETSYFDAEMWLYGFEVYITSFSPSAGNIYTITLTYEVYW